MSNLASLLTILLVLAPALAAAVIAGGRLQARRAGLWSAGASSLSMALSLGLIFRGPRGPVAGLGRRIVYDLPI